MTDNTPAPAQLFLLQMALVLGSLAFLHAADASVEDIHRDALVLDAHADIEIPGKESRYVGADGRSQVAPDKMRAGRVDAVVMAIAVGPGPRTESGDQEARARADEELAAILEMTGQPDDDLVLVRNADELVAAHEQGQLAYILGLQNARIFGRDIDSIDEFFDAGVRVFALTHMGHNDFADSSRPVFIAEIGEHEPAEEHGGLSELGRAAVTRISRLGGILDISQLSRAAALEAIALSSAPVIASHSAAQALTNVSRNLSDEELDLIARKGGVVHVPPFRGYLYDSSDASLDADIRKARREAGLPEDFLYPFELYWELHDPAVQQRFLQTVSERLGPGSVDMMLNHIDYIADRIGVDHVGIGTDFNHGSGVVGFMGAADAMNVTAGLVERGYSADDIRKIWGGNFLRVFRAAAVSAPGASLGDTTNLVELGVPDVLRAQVAPYDSRIFDIKTTVAGQRCCQRDMYQMDGYKIVLLSHQGEYFIAFLLTDDSQRYFVAESRGKFVESTFGRGTRWKVPDWLAEQ